MMDRYEDKSDFEINKAVAEALYPDHKVGMSGFGNSCNFPRDKRGVWVERPDGYGLVDIFQPCENPSDAWPIITENRISIHAYCIDNKWFAHHETDESFETESKLSDNPLRAAMIVFLKMQQDET